MAALQCDVCGGKLTMDSNGKTATCDFCGMTHSLERVREMVQEIKGTVKVEGTVSARQTGTGEDVRQWKVLLSRYMSTFNWKDALKTVNKILEADPTDEEATKIYDDLQELQFYEIVDKVLIKYHGQSGNIVIPEGVVKIGEEAFYDKSKGKQLKIHTLKIPDDVTEIGARAFRRSEIRQLVLPNSLTEIGKESFAEVNLLEEVVIPDSVQRLGEGAFHWCYSLKSVVLGVGIVEIEEDSFCACDHLQKVTFGHGLLKIKCAAFAGCPLSEIILPNTLLEIGKNAFSLRGYVGYEYRSSKTGQNERINLLASTAKEIRIPHSVRSIEDGTFEEWKFLKKLDLGVNVTTIGTRAFYNTGIEELKLPPTLTCIEECAFGCCSKLKSVSIPKTVSFIGCYAFANCESLSKIVFEGREAKLEVRYEAIKLTVSGIDCCWSDTLSNTLYEKNAIMAWKQDRERERRKQEELELRKDRRYKGICQHCGGSFKGLFTKTCKCCGKEKDY